MSEQEKWQVLTVKVVYEEEVEVIVRGDTIQDAIEKFNYNPNYELPFGTVTDSKDLQEPEVIAVRPWIKKDLKEV